MLVIEGYGLTETVGSLTSTIRTTTASALSDRPATACEVTVAEDGEFLIRGDIVFAGYFKEPEATRAALTEAAGCAPATWARSTATAS